MPKKKAKEGKPEVHKDIDGFDININQFGEIKTTLNFEKLNAFLNKNLDDKKLREKEEKEKKD